MAKTEIANLRGAPGPKGDRGLQGDPGVNAVENATAVTAYIDTPGNPVRVALDSKFARRSYSSLSENIFGMYRLKNFRTGVNEVIAGTRDAKILCIGDSTTSGRGSTADFDGTYPQRKSWPTRLADRLNKFSINASTGLAVPKPAPSSQLSDNRWTLGTGWSQSSQEFGFGGRSGNYTANPGAGLLQFNDPEILADRYDIYYATNTSTGMGTFTASATGGADVVVQTGSQSAREIRKVTVQAGSASTANIVSIRNSGAASPVYIIAIEPWRVQLRKVRIGNAGVSGSTSADWVRSNAGTTGWNSVGAIVAYSPDLTIIDLGINDAGQSVPAATLVANLQQLVAAAVSVNSDVLMKTMIPSQSAQNVTYEELYVPALKGMGYPWIDTYSQYKPWADADAEGLMYDSVHPNDAGYSDIGDFVFAAISSVI